MLCNSLFGFNLGRCSAEGFGVTKPSAARLHSVLLMSDLLCRQNVLVANRARCDDLDDLRRVRQQSLQLHGDCAMCLRLAMVSETPRRVHSLGTPGDEPMWLPVQRPRVGFQGAAPRQWPEPLAFEDNGGVGLTWRCALAVGGIIAMMITAWLQQMQRLSSSPLTCSEQTRCCWASDEVAFM